MSARFLRFLFIIFLFIPLSSCGQPTYSKEKISESIIKLCKDEYKLDVTVKIIGTTLGVYIPIEGLVDPDLKLDQKAGEKIEDVALSIHRVVMSTDKPLNIYTLTARDTKAIGAEFVLTGYVYDVLRVRLLDISRDEYHKRILRDFKFNPTVTGETKIKDFFTALNENPTLVAQVKNIFYPIYTIGKPDSQKIEIIEIDTKEISEREALFYVKTKESYDPMPGFEAYRAIFPSGFNNEYLMLVNVSIFPNPITEIVSKYFYTGTEIRQRNLTDTFGQYKDIGYIGIDGLPKRELEVGWFLSQQIARRIKMLFEENKKLKARWTVQSSEGAIKDSVFQFKFSVSSDTPTGEDDEIIFSKISALSSMILHRCDFEDFDGIEFINISKGEKKIYLSKADLEKFRQGEIKIQEII